jgi:TusA-related sulfurtransferase
VTSAAIAATVDGRPLTCKGAIARLEETFSQLPPGAMVRVLVNDVPGRVDVRAWADRKGHRLLHDVRVGDEFELLVAKGGQAAIPMTSGSAISSP